MLSLALIYAGAIHEKAARLGGVTLQIIRNWALRGRPKLNAQQLQALREIVEGGPIPAIHGVVRWRLKDLAQWVFEEFHITLHETCVGPGLKALSFHKISARPRPFARKELAAKDFKKVFRPTGQRSGRDSRRAAR